MNTPHRLHQSFRLFLPTLISSLSLVTQCWLPQTVAQARPGGLSPQPTFSRARPQSPPPAASKPKGPGKLRRVFDFLKCNHAKSTKENELSRTGPQFPDSYDDSEFSIVALIKGDWAVVVEFEWAPESMVSMTFAVKDVEPFTHMLVEKTVGTRPSNSPAPLSLTRAFRLPERFGTRPQAALITIKAVADAAGKVPADFQLNALGIGDTAPVVPALPNRPGIQKTGANPFQVKASFQNDQPDYLLSSPGPIFMADHVVAVSIDSVNVTPDVVSPQGAFNYNFVSTDRFGRWNADFHQKIRVLRNGVYLHGTRHLKTERFNEHVFIGVNPIPPKSKNWEIKTNRGFSPGEYKIQVTAFSRADAGIDGGKWACRFSRRLTIN